MLRIDMLERGGRDSLIHVPTDQLRDKAILITGASGIVGTHFLFGLHHLQRQQNFGVRVYAVVHREIPGHLEGLSGRDGIEFLRGDLADHAFVDTLPTVDYIVHAATYGQPGMFMEHPEVTLKLNTSVTLELLERFLKPGGRFLFLSTSEVYSGLLHPPFTEDQIGTTTPLHPRACYIEAKRCGETIVNVYHQQGVAAASVRLCLAYGPGTRAGDRRVLNNFVEKALTRNEIRMLDRGEAKRTYCYISDAVNMMWRVLLEGSMSVYNVGGNSTVTIAELAQLAGTILGVPVVFPDHGEAGVAGAPDDVRLDVGRINSEFGTRSFVELETGLRNTIEWQRALYVH